MTRQDGKIICDDCGMTLTPGVDEIFGIDKPDLPTRDYCSFQSMIQFHMKGLVELVHSQYLDALLSCWYVRHKDDDRDSLIDLPYQLAFQDAKGGERICHCLGIDKHGGVKFILDGGGEIAVPRLSQPFKKGTEALVERLEREERCGGGHSGNIIHFPNEPSAS